MRTVLGAIPGRNAVQPSGLLQAALIVIALAAYVAKGDPAALSSFECVGEEGRLHDDQRVCWFHNVFYWHGQLFYVSNDTDTFIPKINTRFGAGDDRTAYLNPIVVRQADVHLEFAELVTYGEDTDVYLWSTTPENNWFHQIGEYQPTLHSTLCKYMGRCTYKDRQKLQLLEIYPGPNLPHKWADWLGDLNKCFAPDPKVTVQHPEYYEKVIYIKKGLAGVGPECRARHFCSGNPLEQGGSEGRKPLPSDMLKGYRQRMAECVGFDAERTARVDPIRLVVIDRHYQSARHILNIGQTMDVIHERYGDIANISLHYMEGLSAREQIHLWSSADLVVHVHGATQGSWLFLPKQAVVVHIVQHPAGVTHDNSYADQLVADLRWVTNVTYFPVNNLDMAYAHFKTEVISKHEQWRALSAEDKIKVLEGGTCEHLSDRAMRTHCHMWWFHKNINLVLRPEILVPQMDAAVAELYSKLGRPLPAGFPKPFDPAMYQHRRSGGGAPLGRRLLAALARGFRGWDR